MTDRIPSLLNLSAEHDRNMLQNLEECPNCGCANVFCGCSEHFLSTNPQGSGATSLTSGPVEL